MNLLICRFRLNVRQRSRWRAGFVLVGIILALVSCATHEPSPSHQLKDVVKVAAGWTHSCIVNGKGHVKCWGSNKYGQLGDGTHTGKRAPVDVTGLMMGAKDVTVGERHTCAVTVVGGLKCWGSNHDFQLGDGSRQDRVTPVDVADLKNDVRAAAAGEQHTCILTAVGGVKCWGNNHEGQLGDGTTGDKSKPIDVDGLTSGVTAVTAGWSHTCALTNSGGAKCWGSNQDGQLGDGTTIMRNTPTDVVGLAGGVTALAAGGRHTCALLATGAVKCWGQNQRGQLGDGTTADRVAPINVADLTGGVIALTAGWQHSCALMLNGSIKCWGNNGNGQLGVGNLLLKVTATDVTWIPTAAVAVAAGREHTCALLADNAVRCWGDDEQGQLGKDTKVSRRLF